jgi:folylpolyglutamate synthase/dihydrofolate synthase
MEAEDKEKQLTFFEFTTGLAFKHFAEEKVDIVVTEVGMGGRLDATNVITPEVAAITRIGLEHTNYLGNTIQDVAREKAGIIKTGARVVTCERGRDALSVIETTCKKKGASLRMIGKDFDVSNIHQTLQGASLASRPTSLEGTKLRTQPGPSRSSKSWGSGESISRTTTSDADCFRRDGRGGWMSCRRILW